MTWYILIPVILLVIYLGVPSMLISLANTPAVLIGGNAKFRGTGRYKLATLFAFLFQTTVALTLSALIITYTRYAAPQGFGWVIGIIAAIYPMWQTNSHAAHERLHEPAAYLAKQATHAAIPIALIATIAGTLLFVVRYDILDAMFYWLLISSGLVYVCATISLITIIRRN